MRHGPIKAEKTRRSQKASGLETGSGSRPEAPKRKLIGFDPETWHALQLYSRESMRSVQEIADEAFADVLHKHHRPTDLKEALRESAGRQKVATSRREPSPRR
jgi:hypothetical protein